MPHELSGHVRRLRDRCCARHTSERVRCPTEGQPDLAEVGFVCGASPALELPYVRGLGWADEAKPYVLLDLDLSVAGVSQSEAGVRRLAVTLDGDKAVMPTPTRSWTSRRCGCGDTSHYGGERKFVRRSPLENADRRPSPRTLRTLRSRRSRSSKAPNRMPSVSQTSSTPASPSTTCAARTTSTRMTSTARSGDAVVQVRGLIDFALEAGASKLATERPQ